MEKKTSERKTWKKDWGDNEFASVVLKTLFHQSRAETYLLLKQITNSRLR